MSLIVLTIFNIYITIADDEWIYDAFSILTNLSLEFRLSVLCIAFVNGTVTFFFEKIGIWYISIWWKNRKDKIREANYRKEIEA